MDKLRRELAPISQEAWNEIDAMARETLKASLSGRKIVDVHGPRGFDYAGVPLGRLSVPKQQPAGEVRYGLHQVLPLVETRVDFSLDIWELDNIGRGARDPDLDALVEACRKIAAFEEKAVFDGFKAGSFIGLHEYAKDRKVGAVLNSDAFLDAVAEGQAMMRRDGVDAPANLVVSVDIWKFLGKSVPGGTLRSIVERQIGGRVVYSEAVKDAMLVSARGGDAELTVGQDLAIGYNGHDTTKVSLYLLESFAFRVITPQAIVGLRL
ncbi:MAG TPA: family 1 encapsulin nanocompartment shell protein [Spirochaetales bacterium]|nr:family 1 encapsulin nanocompartment shell protein [Spirochaetales bacterium]